MVTLWHTATYAIYKYNIYNIIVLSDDCLVTVLGFKVLVAQHFAGIFENLLGSM